MKYAKRYLDSAAKELTKASNRIGKLLGQKKNHLAFLERSYEGCWAYPDYEEKSKKYGDLIDEAQKAIEELSEMRNIIDGLKERTISFNDSRIMKKYTTQNPQ